MPTSPDAHDGALSAELEGLFGDTANLETMRAREAIRMRVFGNGARVRVGRFEVHERLGAGGMGIVYAARDPDLDRVIALKLLRVDRGDGRRADYQQLRGEARALAQLDHPNIVAVYDAGQVGDVLYIAMELVRGPDLRSWLLERRSVVEILAVLRDIAAGVAAAHDAGIVHRDLKPENVLIGPDARPRVVDFGLARAAGRVHDSTPAIAEGAQSTRPAGTPGYVAPEVVDGTPGDARSDVYSFCATSYEALYGRLPDPSETQAPLRARDGQRVAEPIRTALVRGLDARPERRPSTMHALLLSIEQGMRVRGRWKAIVAGSVLAALVTTPLVIRRIHLERSAAACEREGDAIADVWGERQRQQLLEAPALLSSEASRVGAAASIISDLDDYAMDWATMRIELCHRAEVDAVLGRRLHARARACLDERRARVEAFVDLVTSGSGETGVRPNAVAVALSPIAPCGDEDELARSNWPEDPDVAATMAGLRKQLNRATTLLAEHRDIQGAAMTSAIMASAHIHGLAELAADAQTWHGRFLVQQGRYADAERALTEAYYLASRAESDLVMARAAGYLVFVVGTLQRRGEDGLRWGRHAVVASERADFGPDLAASVHSNIGTLLELHGRYAEALAEHEKSLELLDASENAPPDDVGRAFNNLATAWLELGELDEAEAGAENALAIREAAWFGPFNFSVGSVRITLGLIASAQGRPNDAIRHFEQALTSRLIAFGPAHPETADLLAQVGLVQLDAGDLQAAVDHVDRSLAMFERTVGPDAPEIVFSLTVMARIRLELGELEAAEVSLQRALRICEAGFGPANRACASPIELFGRLALARNDHDVAIEHAERSLAIREATLGPDHSRVADALVLIGEARLENGAVDAAVAALERALSLRIAARAHAFLVAEAQHRLATALWAEGRDRARALELARAAAHGYAESELDASRRLPVLEAWLEKAINPRWATAPREARRPSDGGL